MDFTLHTYDIQDIVIALICNDSFVLKENQKRVDKLKDVFAKLNTMCSESNDWTITIHAE